jgi:hypothetical protein
VRLFSFTDFGKKFGKKKSAQNFGHVPRLAKQLNGAPQNKKELRVGLLTFKKCCAVYQACFSCLSV